MSPTTLPRWARLLRREQYTTTLAEGAAESRRHFSLYFRPNGLSHARIGIIASKRIAPRAVDRNRARRLVREAFRKARSRLAGVDVVVRLRRCPPGGTGAMIAAEIARLLEELSQKQERC